MMHNNCITSIHDDIFLWSAQPGCCSQRTADDDACTTTSSASVPYLSGGDPRTRADQHRQCFERKRQRTVCVGRVEPLLMESLTFSTAQAEACCSKCSGNNQCAAWTFHLHIAAGEDNCFLKNNVKPVRGVLQ